MKAPAVAALVAALALLATTSVAEAQRRMPGASAPTTVIPLYGTPGQGALVRGQVPPDTRLLTLDDQRVDVAADGAFIIGFGRDAAPTSTLVATLADGRRTTMRIAVAPRTWRTETVGGVPRRPLPDAAFARIRAGELAQIASARATTIGGEGWRQRFVWPTTGRVSGLFGSQRIYANGERGDPHSGVDVARPTGTPVVAPADGVVVLAAQQPFTLEGRLLIVDHGMGLNSAFLHLSRIDVRVGDRVRQGQQIGAVGATGRASGPHLHWGMRWRDARIDPLLVAGPMPAN